MYILYISFACCIIILTLPNLHFQSSKPPPHSKRKTSPVVVSDDDDKSPPRTRQAQKKRQKAATPSGKEKGYGSSKLTSPGDKVSSEESPLKGGSNAFVVESHNSSPDNIPTKVFGFLNLIIFINFSLKIIKFNALPYDCRMMLSQPLLTSNPSLLILILTTSKVNAYSFLQRRDFL